MLEVNGRRRNELGSGCCRKRERYAVRAFASLPKPVLEVAGFFSPRLAERSCESGLPPSVTQCRIVKMPSILSSLHSRGRYDGRTIHPSSSRQCRGARLAMASSSDLHLLIPKRWTLLVVRRILHHEHQIQRAWDSARTVESWLRRSFKMEDTTIIKITFAARGCEALSPTARATNVADLRWRNLCRSPNGSLSCSSTQSL